MCHSRVSVRGLSSALSLYGLAVRIRTCVLLWFGVPCSALELEPHERALADDPGVVPRHDFVCVSGAYVYRRTILRNYFHLARDSVAHVVGLARFRLDDWFDRFRPLPARLEGHPAYSGVPQGHQVDLAELELS